MIANHKGEIPVVLLLLPFLLGIGLGTNLLSGANTLWLIIGLAIFSCIFIALNLTYNKFHLYKRRWLGGVLIVIILFLAGWLSFIKHNELCRSDHFSKTHSRLLVVKINNEPVFKNGFLRFTATVKQALAGKNKTTVSGNILIAIRDSNAKTLRYGDQLLIPASYKPADPPFNPAEFNYKNYLSNQNIHYQEFLFPKQYVVLATNTGNPVITWSHRLRRHLVEKLKLNIPDTNAVALASTIILGYKADLSDNVREAYAKTGAVHVLSVSGSQVAFIYFILLMALRFLDGYRYGKVIKASIIIILIWYYALLTGFSPAVCRASVMVSMVIIGKTYNRYINTLNILAISAFLLLFYNPYFISDVGFQLSYIAISGLVIFRPIVYRWLKFKNKWADKLWGLCSLSIAAQVITFPLSMYYFHQLPVYFLFSNLLVIIPVALIMYSGILYLLLPQIPVISKTLAFVLEKTIVLMTRSLSYIEQAPFSGISKIWPTIPEYLLLYAVIISLFYFLYSKRVAILQLSLVCMLLLSLSWCVKSIRLSRSENITFLSFSKHTGIVFRNGNSAVVLSDLKPIDKNWQYSVHPYLDSCQINNIQLVALNQDVKTPWFAKSDNLVQFLDSRIILLTKKSQDNSLSHRLKTNYLYIIGNPYNQLSQINNNFDYHALIADGGNSDQFIEQVERKFVNYKILKRNKSIISISN